MLTGGTRIIRVIHVAQCFLGWICTMHWFGSVLCTDPALPITTADGELDDLFVDRSDV